MHPSDELADIVRGAITDALGDRVPSDLAERLDRIEEQVNMTNGRVSKLEAEKIGRDAVEQARRGRRNFWSAFTIAAVAVVTLADSLANQLFSH